ncbi:SMC family ATPase [Nocardioides bigeumensis]|uniref:Nuclease SbcCD subunit C n=1 Tax=Nocardioides bigeumensis TaxID=433657 RepID=A0ABP5JW65_9ACTN
MRLHHLRITAFGPFGDTVEVDFDALSGAGLFLLSGATGAGKTSVLDAVCFALYGDVPGDRGSAKRLRSDQAEAGVAPEVVLEATLSGRRFRIQRSPAWERPKRRGSGMTTQQASVVVSERVDGAWRTRSTRLDEAGHLVGDLVGLNVEQFCQVAMLPQGRFQAFLRARSEDRHKLLQQLFRTGRFEDVEKWLRERRTTLRRESETHEQAVADLVSRLSEAAPPVALAGRVPDLGEVAGAARTEGWATLLLALAEDAHERARHDAAVTERAASLATADLATAERLAELQDRHAAARAELSRLDKEETQHFSSVRRLEAAGRAGRILPLIALAEGARTRSVEARAVEASARAALADHGLPADRLGDPDELARTRDQARLDAAAARALQPREEQLDAMRRKVETYAARVQLLDDELTQHETALALLPGRLERTRAQHREAVAAAAALAGAESSAADLHKRVAAAAQHAALAPQLEEAKTALVLAVEEVHLLTEQWLHLREQRIEGMAAEMAQTLVVGGGCPVCGSEHHPHPARVGGSSVDAEAERAARKAVDDAEATKLLREEQVRDLRTRLEIAELMAGTQHGRLGQQVEAADAEASRLRELAETAATLEARVAAMEQEAGELTRRRDAAKLEKQGVVSAETTERSQVAQVTAEIQALLWETDDPDLATRGQRLTALAAACDAALSAMDRAAHAHDDAARAEQSLADALRASGFADALSAAEAHLEPDDLEALGEAVRAHEAARLAARQAYDDVVLVEAAAAPAPDLVSIRGVADDTRAAAAEAVTTLTMAAGRFERLEALHAAVSAAVAAWQPVKADLDLTSELSAFVDGRSPDNRLQMRLSAYVLAYRLAQVVDAANDRLARMSDRRYSLVHTGRKGAGENRGGLSLLVRDDWSGESRDPATLSGGETFVVSLALALGLADVITQESDSGSRGDTRLDTLFVDEGFGSLDADTLDDVMDTLDSLREGGRVVGVVSHVAEMRDRIPVRLEVVKDRRGSTLRNPVGSVRS